MSLLCTSGFLELPLQGSICPKSLHSLRLPPTNALRNGSIVVDYLVLLELPFSLQLESEYEKVKMALKEELQNASQEGASCGEDSEWKGLGLVEGAGLRATTQPAPAQAGGILGSGGSPVVPQAGGEKSHRSTPSWVKGGGEDGLTRFWVLGKSPPGSYAPCFHGG